MSHLPPAPSQGGGIAQSDDSSPNVRSSVHATSSEKQASSLTNSPSLGGGGGEVLVSVIIPVYNVSPYIGRCLTSALDQSYKNIEYIVVDDAATDDSMAIARDVIYKHPRKSIMKVVHHPDNRGLSAARNTGVKAATGDYIYFLDSDDEIPADAIETLAELAAKGVDMALGDIKVIGGEASDYPALKMEPGVYMGNGSILETYLKGEWYEMAWNKLIRRRFFTEEECWFEEGIVHEDTLWSFQAAAAIQSLAVSGKKTYYYHVHEGSITGKKTKKNILDFYKVIKEIIRTGKAKRLFDKQAALVPYLDNLRVYFLKSLLINPFDNAFRKEQSHRIKRLYKEEVRPMGRESVVNKIKRTILELRIKR